MIFNLVFLPPTSFAIHLFPSACLSSTSFYYFFLVDSFAYLYARRPTEFRGNEMYRLTRQLRVLPGTTGVRLRLERPKPSSQG